MESFKWFIISLILLSCNPNGEKKIELTGVDVLNKSIEYHDPNQNWINSEINIHIQEPRINNPFRYSELKLKVRDGSFELKRNRENHISKHTINEEGVSKVYLDNNETIKEEFIEKYRLDPERNFGYRDFYKMLIGLPMSLNDSVINSIGVVEHKLFNSEDCYMIPIELKRPIFSDHWNIFIKKSTYEYKGMEIIFPNDSLKGERLIFEGAININKMNLARIRHWYEYHDNSYSGSDIILKETE